MPRPGNRRNLNTARFRRKQNKYTRRVAKREATRAEKESANEFITYKTIEGAYAAAYTKRIVKEFEAFEEFKRDFFEKQMELEKLERVYKELSKQTTNPEAAEQVSVNGVRTMKRSGIKRLSLRDALIVFLFFFAPTANAKWNEWSAPPNETSAWDTLSMASAVGAWAAYGVAGLTAPLPPVAVGFAAVGTGLKLLAGASKAAGVSHRAIDHFTRKHEMTPTDMGFTLATGLAAAAGPLAEGLQAGRAVAITANVAHVSGGLAEAGAALFPRTLGLSPSTARKKMGADIAELVEPAGEAPTEFGQTVQKEVIGASKAVAKRAQEAIENAHENPIMVEERLKLAAARGVQNYLAERHGIETRVAQEAAMKKARDIARKVYEKAKNVTGIQPDPENEAELPF